MRRVQTSLKLCFDGVFRDDKYADQIFYSISFLRIFKYQALSSLE